MTVLALAFLFSDSALNASTAADYRLSEERETRAFAEAEGANAADQRRWTPGFDGWTRKKAECPAFFQRDMGGFGTFRFGPQCTEEEPYALSDPAYR